MASMSPTKTTLNLTYTQVDCIRMLLDNAKEQLDMRFDWLKNHESEPLHELQLKNVTSGIEIINSILTIIGTNKATK